MTTKRPSATPVAEPADPFAAYWPAVRRRHARELADRKARHRRAWAEARVVAELLKRRFGATSVWAFGSLVHPEHFDQHSDIDLAVDGVPPSRFFRAWAEAAANTSFEIDLIDIADGSPALKAVILEEGVVL